MNRRRRISVRIVEEVIPTYMPAMPDVNPMFLEQRVYQGSSGRVYPLPFTDRIATEKIDRRWTTVWLENEYLRVMVLPELGGRIQVAQDKTNGYDFIYRQTVIKPALVGLAGPWISGGIEFNWPQHHRPATFLPVDFQVEPHPDGSQTVWCGDHDPMSRMKGMHGVCLHPGKAYIELKVRVHNRTGLVQTFLWWANVATRVHEGYQSFFPPDVRWVVDHAKRAVSAFPLCQGTYYGVDYLQRSRARRRDSGASTTEPPPMFKPLHGGHGAVRYAANDLSFYANIPVPTSYMAAGSRADFFGGYDHHREAGIVHIANHHIAPGKKQWTWGNHAFGYAWDRNLTDEDGPYIELMAGVYTDNQPDFSFLHPGETKSWSQFWYPIQRIGPAQQANRDAAISLRVDRARAQVGVAVTVKYPSATIVLSHHGRTIAHLKRGLAPGAPFVEQLRLPSGVSATRLKVQVLDRAGHEIIAYQPAEDSSPAGPAQSPATEPAAPRETRSVDELYLTGLHLEQYRHATRSGTDYWREALRRDPFDARCNTAMGIWHFRRGEPGLAEVHLRRAIERLTLRNPNPRDGEPYYHLGQCLRHRVLAEVNPGQKHRMSEEAYAAFYKSTWNQGWAAAGYQALGEMDAGRKDWSLALDHLERSLRLGVENNGSANLKVMVLRQLGRRSEAQADLIRILAVDPLDWWARHLSGQSVTCDLQVRLDIAHDLARAGFYSAAIGILEHARTADRDLPDQNLGAKPLVAYTIGWLHRLNGNGRAAREHYQAASALKPDYCFPARLEEILVLNDAMRIEPRDSRAPYYLGNLLYDRRRHAEAISLWERSAKRDPAFSVVWRNLGIGYFNVRHQPRKARAAYDRALKAAPTNARLCYERDQLLKRTAVSPKKRLAELERFVGLVRQRDDLTVELCALYNQVGQPAKALASLNDRHFQPWEGGEGQALGQYARARLLLGQEALASRNATVALEHFQAASHPSVNLGEARHMLASKADIEYWLGKACYALGDRARARRHWRAAATEQGDFQEMRVQSYSEQTFYSAMALERLGRTVKAAGLLRKLKLYARQLGKAEAKVDYFATSLPTLLLFDDDLLGRQQTTALFLEAQAWLGLGATVKSRRLLQAVLRRDPSHPAAADLARTWRGWVSRKG